MTKQTSAIGAVAAVLVAVCAGLTVSQSAAEPMVEDDILNIPSEAASQKQSPSDALTLFKARDYEGSLRLWQEAAAKNLDMPPAQLIMAQLYAQANMLGDCRNALEQAVHESPNDPEPYIFMANFALRDGDAGKAESLLEKAGGLLATFEKSAKRKKAMQLQLQSSLATVAQSRKDWPGAEKAIAEALKLDPKNVAILQRSAYCAFQQKNVEIALGELREAAKIDPAMLAPEAVLAQYYQKTGDNENAKKWMAAAVVAAPKNLKTQLAVGQRALEQGQLEEARKHAIAAMRIDPKSQQANLFRGAIAMFEKDYEAAESYFETALRQSPEDFSLRNNLAVALVEQPDERKNRRALEYAEANVKKYPAATEAASTYAWVLYKLKRLDDAEKAIVGAAPALASDLDVAYVTARIAVDRGHKEEARRILAAALTLTAPALFRQEAEDLFEQLKRPDAKK
jgi:tetratricopeptide (TPR) repeat protein